jgi:hypothetical protein
VTEIRRRRALMPTRLGADPAFGYDSQWWDNFGPRERDPVRRAAFLGEADPNPYTGMYMPEPGPEPPQREPFIEEMEEDDDEEEAPLEVHVKQEVGGDDIPGEEPRDDTEDYCGCIAYGILDAMDRGEAPPSPPPLTEEEQLRVALLVSEEEEKRRWAGYETALAISLHQQHGRPPSPPPPPGPPPPPPAAPGPPPPPAANWPWPQSPYIILPDEDDE